MTMYWLGPQIAVNSHFVTSTTGKTCHGKKLGELKRLFSKYSTFQVLELSLTLTYQIIAPRKNSWLCQQTGDTSTFLVKFNRERFKENLRYKSYENFSSIVINKRDDCKTFTWPVFIICFCPSLFSNFTTVYNREVNMKNTATSKSSYFGLNETLLCAAKSIQVLWSSNTSMQLLQ